MTGAHTILVMEDNDEDFAMIERGLVQAGVPHCVERFMLVRELREWLARGQEASLAFFDLNLPGESGHSALKTIKEHPRYRSMPILVMTTSANATDVKQCYAFGANAYHVKPMEPPMFHKVVADIASYWFREARLPANA